MCHLEHRIEQGGVGVAAQEQTIARFQQSLLDRLADHQIGFEVEMEAPFVVEPHATPSDLDRGRPHRWAVAVGDRRPGRFVGQIAQPGWGLDVDGLVVGRIDDGRGCGVVVIFGGWTGFGGLGERVLAQQPLQLTDRQRGGELGDLTIGPRGDLLGDGSELVQRQLAAIERGAAVG